MSSPRLVAACLAAAVTPALLLSGYIGIAGVINQNFDALFAMVIFAFIMMGFLATVHICLLGLPIYFVLHKRNWINGWTAGLTGFAIGGLPITLIFSLGFWTSEITTQTWWSLAGTLGFYGLFGTAGSMAAWAIWRFGPDVPDR